MNTEQIGTKIIEVATHFLGLHETASNAAWDNPETAGEDQAAKDLLAALEATGWQKGWSYCAAMVEAVWRTAYTEAGAPAALVQHIAQLLTPSVMGSFNNVRRSLVNPESRENDPRLRDPISGSIFFMQKGQSGFGHAGLCVKAGGQIFTTIEGNTSDPDAASSEEREREGEGIYRKSRKLDFTPKPGLWLRGFFNPIPW